VVALGRGLVEHVRDLGGALGYSADVRDPSRRGGTLSWREAALVIANEQWGRQQCLGQRGRERARL
jgi:hypothetical protein